MSDTKKNSKNEGKKGKEIDKEKIKAKEGEGKDREREKEKEKEKEKESEASLKTKQKDYSQQLALDYHSQGRPGKIEVRPTKPCLTAYDLSLAYTPGVAQPCLEIVKDERNAYKYTAKGNLVGVITNGSAVLGLGNIGALAGKPVMEGKGVLFKRFADIDVFDIELNAPTAEEMIQAISSLAPTFGGINLEDIKAPECFEVESRLQEMLDIPVFHDDQHGTAIIASAAFLNSLEITKKKINKVTTVINGAGAAAVACGNLLVALGVERKNIIMCDSKGVIYKGRKDGMNSFKEAFAVETERRTLADALVGCDFFLGVSVAGILTQDMVRSMAKNPVIFALANPIPEIYPNKVFEVRDDAIMATGRSDFPNQVNNVLGFPFIFRGALDVKARKINEAMKLAAVKALAELAKEEVPEEVRMAYGGKSFAFGPEYLIPKPFDSRVLTRVSPAVAKAAMDSGIAREPIEDFTQYKHQLQERLGVSFSFMRNLRSRISTEKKQRIGFTDPDNHRVLKAVSVILEEGCIQPVLIGPKKRAYEQMDLLGLQHLKGLPFMYPEGHPRFQEFWERFYEERQRKGMSKSRAVQMMKDGKVFGPMMVREGELDGLITGVTLNYGECFNRVQTVIADFKQKACGVFIMVFENRVILFADCAVQVNPSSEDLADIALNTAHLYTQLLHKDPQIAFLSFSNFGSSKHEDARKVSRAVELVRQQAPNLIVDGEMQADVAVNDKILSNLFEFSTFEKGTSADILIFPNLDAGNIAFKLINQMADVKSLGPVLLPTQSSINIMARTATSSEIVNMATITALLAQMNKENGQK